LISNERHAPDVEAAYAALFASRSAADRLRMTCDMFDTAKAPLAARIRASDPEISSEELRIRNVRTAVFRRLRRADVPTDHSRIARHSLMCQPLIRHAQRCW
jgi:hypothetical protein